MIIKTNADEIQNYLTDASNLKGNCDAVYIPENVEELREVLKEANKNKTAVTISGSGTGMTGARVPDGGIVITTEKLNKIIELNIEEKFAVVEPAVLLSEFQNLVSENGLLYPPDPTERNCFIGGTVATNASGEKSFKYGATREYVFAIDVAMANGEMLQLERGKQKAVNEKLNLITSTGRKIEISIPAYVMPTTKNASGYFCKPGMDAIDLFIGSEGTLGVITKIKLTLVSKPEKILSCLLFFKTEEEALGFIIKARDMSLESQHLKNENEINALALEFFDDNALKFLSGDYSIIPPDAYGAVWFEQEVTMQNEDGILMKWMELIEEFGGDEETAWIALNEIEIKKIQEFRHAVSAKVNEYISKNNFKKLGTDVAVPNEHFVRFYKYCTNLVKETKLNYVTYGHFGNSHIHLNMLPKNEEEHLLGKELYKNICHKAVELHGTVSAEHGIGKLKTDYLKMMYGEETIKEMAALKKTLDPNLILGIGNIIDETFLE
ncbi:MAG: FAD-binding oxidoreductase [Ignavibacteriaceae bacterium]|nr:FAD-binding oxidoreductase [Ignavibacteriaceae bacterium]